MNWEIRKPPLELGPCENQERKGKTRIQKKALSQHLSPPTDIILSWIHQHSSPAPRHPPNPLLCRVMADPTPCSSSAVPYTSTLPPLPTPPYRPHSLVNYINDFTLLDPTDLSSGAPSSSTAVESGNVTAWNFRSIRFSLHDTMLERLENRLRWLRLDEHRPQTLGVPNSRSPLTMTEDDVRVHLDEIFSRVNSIIRNGCIKTLNRAEAETDGVVSRYGEDSVMARAGGLSAV
jgi:hypothetical protein